jgi:hypothetical protein
MDWLSKFTSFQIAIAVRLLLHFYAGYSMLCFGLFKRDVSQDRNPRGWSSFALFFPLPHPQF